MKKIIFFTFLCSLSFPALAGIMIHPKFLFFDDKTKVSEIILINSDQKESSNYRVSLSYKIQNHDGSYTDLSENPKNSPADSAVSLLRYSPRAAFLSAQRSQIIRVLKRLPQELSAGDYVAYITFTEVLMEKPLTKQIQQNTLSIKITPIPAFSIPIIVRYKHKEEAKVSLQVLEQEYIGQQPSVKFRILKEKKEKGLSNLFVRGDISIWLQEELVGFIRGKYILPSNDYVDITIPLKRAEIPLTWEDLKGKKLKILFTKPSEEKLNKKEILAQQEIKF